MFKSSLKKFQTDVQHHTINQSINLSADCIIVLLAATRKRSVIWYESFQCLWMSVDIFCHFKKIPMQMNRLWVLNQVIGNFTQKMCLHEFCIRQYHVMLGFYNIRKIQVLVTKLRVWAQSRARQKATFPQHRGNQPKIRRLASVPAFKDVGRNWADRPCHERKSLKYADLMADCKDKGWGVWLYFL